MRKIIGFITLSFLLSGCYASSLTYMGTGAGVLQGKSVQSLGTHAASYAIQKETGSEHVGGYVQATHGCCENRGIRAHSSLTQTTVLRGAFNNDPATKKEFMDNVKLQQEFACGK